MKIGNHRRTHINSSKYCRGRTDKNIIKNHVLIHLGIKPNTISAGYKGLTPNPSKSKEEALGCRAKRGNLRERALLPGGHIERWREGSPRRRGGVWRLGLSSGSARSREKKEKPTEQTHDPRALCGLHGGTGRVRCSLDLNRMRVA
jgi:hypothetical protein